MKLIIYVLDSNGTIPAYVIDGGYLVWNNGGTSPQDLDLVGVATDEAIQDGFANEASLLAYAESKNFVFKVPHTEEITPLEDVISSIWAKLT
jgi:hypothetical protein